MESCWSTLPTARARAICLSGYDRWREVNRFASAPTTPTTQSLTSHRMAPRSWSSAPRHLGSRDRYIGWSAEARRRNIRFIAYNTRFLILPWVRVPHLASHLLGRMAAVHDEDWQRMYGHPIYFAETFIDPSRYRGTCYRAANWRFLGMTTGRGKASTSKRPNRSF